MNDEIRKNFLEAAEAWVCNGYSLDIRYIVDASSGEGRVWSAAIQLHPLPAPEDNSFCIEVGAFRAGQIQRPSMQKKPLLGILRSAAAGDIPLANCGLATAVDRPIDCYSEMAMRDRWFSPLHLQMRGARGAIPPTLELAAIDNKLRATNPPFDGLQDLSRWLALPALESSLESPSITISIGPPVDLLLDHCALNDDQLQLTIHAHPKLDTRLVSLAIRSVPGNGLGARMQIANRIKWNRSKNGRREGRVEFRVENADQLFAVLMIGGATVRRHWFLDPAKARNNRFLAVQHFDKELRMVRNAVLDATDSARFESGIATLLFLLGFTPSVQLETDAPDLIVATPSGRLTLVECTTRIADFGVKVGKLIDRRGGLELALSASGHPMQVAAVLVCRLPRSQIAARVDELQSHRVILLTGEDLVSAFDRLRYPNDPDGMLDTALNQLGSQ